MKRTMLLISCVLLIALSAVAQQNTPVKPLPKGLEYVDYAIDFPENLRLVRTKDVPANERLYGLYDAAGNEITPCVWHKITAPSDGLMRVQLGKDEAKRVGFINAKGQQVVAVEWEDASSFSEGWAAVQKDNKWGYVDTTGRVVLAPVYADAKAPYNGYIMVGQAGKYYIKYGIAKRNGELVIPMQYYSITYFKAGRVIVGKIINGAPRYGLIDENNTIVMPLEWDFVSITNEGNTWVGKGQYPNSIYTLLDRAGNRMITTDLYDLDSSGKFGHAKAAIRDGDGNLHYGVLSSQGKVIIPFQYDHIMIFTEHSPELGEVAVVAAEKKGQRYSFTLSVQE